MISRFGISISPRRLSYLVAKHTPNIIECTFKKYLKMQNCLGDRTFYLLNNRSQWKVLSMIEKCVCMCACTHTWLSACLSPCSPLLLCHYIFSVPSILFFSPIRFPHSFSYSCPLSCYFLVYSVNSEL